MNAADTTAARIRLDQLLAERGLFASRSRARDAIARGTVAVDGVTAAKPGQMVDAGAAISVGRAITVTVRPIRRPTPRAVEY